MTELKTVHRSIDELVFLIHKRFEKAQAISTEAQKKYKSARLQAGELLLELRGRIEAGEAGRVEWWEWYGEHFVRSRKDAEKCMALASQDDPEQAVAAEKAKNTAHQQAKREKEKEHNPAADKADVSAVIEFTLKPKLKVVGGKAKEPEIRRDKLKKMLAEFMELNTTERHEYLLMVKRAMRV